VNCEFDKDNVNYVLRYTYVNYVFDTDTLTMYLTQTYELRI